MMNQASGSQYFVFDMIFRDLIDVIETSMIILRGVASVNLEIHRRIIWEVVAFCFENDFLINLQLINLHVHLVVDFRVFHFHMITNSVLTISNM